MQRDYHVRCVFFLVWEGVEVKGLVAAAWSTLAAKPFAGRIELWTKWTATSLLVGATIVLKKTRWVRMFDTSGGQPQEIALNEDERPTNGSFQPPRGCRMELTKVALPGGVMWWTVMGITLWSRWSAGSACQIPPELSRCSLGLSYFSMQAGDMGVVFLH